MQRLSRLTLALYASVILLGQSECPEEPSDADGDGYTLDVDCNDENPAINPGATEVCDPLDTDENCNGLANDADTTTDPGSMVEYFHDLDRDTYGAEGDSTFACSDPSTSSDWWTLDSSDCDDRDDTTYPGAEELYDAVDNNCDGLVDLYEEEDFLVEEDTHGDGDTVRITVCDDPTTRDSYQPGVITYIPVAWHIVCKSDGTGCLSANLFHQAKDDLNAAFAPAGLEFFDGSTAYIHDSDYYILDDREESYDLREEYYVHGMINIFFTEHVFGYGGTSSFTNYDIQGIVVRNGNVPGGSTVPHEVGHYFDLFHTHQPWSPPCSGSGTDELVDGSNCEYAGDLLCDTPADPRPYSDAYTNGFTLNGSCQLQGAGQDCNGDTYEPLVDNIMSYAPSVCRTNFTPQQLSRTLCVLSNLRTELDAGQTSTLPVDVATADTIFVGQNSQDRTGNSVDIALDTNGNGRDDVLIGTTNKKAFLLEGGSIPSGTSSVTAAETTVTAEHRLGEHVTSVGDINGDGFGDVVIASPDYIINNYQKVGAYHLFYGPIDLGLIDISGVDPDATFLGEIDGSKFGHSQAAAGDLNGDGLSDMVFMGRFEPLVGWVADSFYIILGRPDRISGTYGVLEVSDTRVRPSNGFTYNGGKLPARPISASSDLNGDGFDDLAIGLPDEPTTYAYLGGELQIYFGSAILPVEMTWEDADAVYAGSEASGYVGQQVSGGGDLDGDGIDDLVVSGTRDNHAFGTAYVIYGDTNLGQGQTVHGFDLALQEDKILLPTSAVALSHDGDVNGDGFADLLIGNPSNGIIGEENTVGGNTYLFFGPLEGGEIDASRANVLFRAYSVEFPYDNYLGTSVSISGDLNADGMSDICIGAPGDGSYSQPGDNTGVVYCYYGREDFSTLP